MEVEVQMNKGIRGLNKEEKIEKEERRWNKWREQEMLTD